MDFNFLCFTETYLDTNIQTEFVNLPNYEGHSIWHANSLIIQFTCSVPSMHKRTMCALLNSVWHVSLLRSQA